MLGATQHVTSVRPLSLVSAVQVPVGAALLGLLAFGSMTAELGAASLWVWLALTAMGSAQCVLLLVLLRQDPGRSSPVSTAELIASGLPVPLATVARWGYWLGWTPGIAANALVAAELLLGTHASSGTVLGLALGLLLLLYGVAALGIQRTQHFASVLSAVAIVPLLWVLFSLYTHPVRAGLQTETLVSLPSLLKWGFAATWVAYGAETAFSLAGELVRPQRQARTLVLVAVAASFAFFVVVPVTLFFRVGAEVLAQDPLEAFLRSLGQTGSVGRLAMTSMLVAALLSGSLALIVTSSRSLGGMSVGGDAPAWFAPLRKGTLPLRCLLADGLLCLTLLVIFRSTVTDAIAAANVPYLLAFVLLPIAVLRQSRITRATKGLAVFCLIGNIVLFVGALFWGSKIMMAGIALLCLGCGIARLSQRAANREKSPKEEQIET